MEKENEELKTKDEALMLKDFSELGRRSETIRNVYTTIQDQKTIFNLETSCDYKLNDCKGEKIRVKDVLVKINEKPLKKPVIDETTGEILKEKETSMVTILLDETGKSYVTGSKMFTMQLINYIEMFGLQSIREGLEIEICERSIKNSSNKALGFKLV